MRGIRTLPAGPDPRNPVVYQDAPGFPGYKVGSDRSVWSNSPLDGAPPGGWTCIRPVAREGRPPEVPLLRAPGPRRVWVPFGELVDQVFPPPPAAGASAPFVPLPEEDRIGGRVKLDEEKVAELRRLKAEGWTYPRLARRFGIARSTVHYALNGCTWRHVPMVPRPAPPPVPRAPEVPRPKRVRSGPGARPHGVAYREIPGATRYAVGSDRSVWFRTIKGLWRRRKVARHAVHGWSVTLLRDDGRQTMRSVFSLLREVFPEWAGRADGTPPVPPPPLPLPTSTAGGVSYRAIPGCPGYALGSDRSVWASRRGRWRPRKIGRPRPGTGQGGTVTLYRDGRYTSRTLASLMREVFPEGEESPPAPGPTPPG
jgi:hypothetical protein